MAEAKTRTKTLGKTDERAALGHLNAAQREAVTHEGGPLLVIAGAGTGKTAVITERIAWLVREKGYRPDSILALTFTEKAATEMEERVDALLPIRYGQMWVQTFHGFCERILREFAVEIGLDPSFKVLSVPEQWMLLRRHLFELPLSYFRPLGNPTKFLQALVYAISSAKDQHISPEQFDEIATLREQAAEKEIVERERNALREDAVRWREFAGLYRTYERLLVEESAMDFGGLILNTLTLFRERPSVIKRVSERFREVLVDEFQDTNSSQNELLRLLVPDAAGRLTVVGDDDQSIYAWRGSNIANILNFQKWYPGARTVVLTENYRSPQEILDAAYTLIQHNNPRRLEKTAEVVKRLKSARTLRPRNISRLSHRHFRTIDEEHAFIASTIAEFVEKDLHTYRDCVILTRTNAQGDEIVPSLIRRDIPFLQSEARGLLLRPEVRDVASYIRVIANPLNSVALFRMLSLPMFHVEPYERQRLLQQGKQQATHLIDVLRRDDLQKTLSERSRLGVDLLLTLLDRHVEKGITIPVSRLILEFLQDSGYLKWATEHQEEQPDVLPNISAFLDFVKEYERSDPDASIIGFVEYIDLVMTSGESPPQATLSADIDAVRIMTVHSAKGLEFPVVFLMGATADKYPVRARSDILELPEEFSLEQDIDPRDAHLLEERRLFYVAMTRARERLSITSAERTGSQKTRRRPSPFIGEAGIPTEESDTAVVVQQLELPLAAPPAEIAQAHRLVTPKTLSVSQVETYETCPLKYQFQYVYRIPTLPHHALTFGIAIHSVLRDLAQKVGQGTVLTVDDALSLYERYWNNEGFHSPEHAHQQKEHGRDMLKQYFATHPEMFRKTPLLVEEPFRFPLGETTVLGRIDRVDKKEDGTVEVTDFKTGSVKDQKTADTDLQLSVYAIALQEVFHLHADHLTLSFLEGSVDRTSTRTAEQLAQARERVEKAAMRIQAQDFTATPSLHICTFCEFRSICNFSAV